MNKGKLFYEGRAKILYETDNPNILIQHFEDDAAAFDGVKKGKIPGKGVANNAISSALFKYLSKSGIKSHFVEKISDNETVVKRVEIIPVEVVIRNISAGGLCKRYGLQADVIFNKPIMESYYKDDALRHNCNVSCD